MNDRANTEEITLGWWAKNILKILVLTAGIIWKFWLHPQYTTTAVLLLGGAVLVGVAGMLFVRRSTQPGWYLLLLPTGALAATTCLYITHL